MPGLYKRCVCMLPCLWLESLDHVSPATASWGDLDHIDGNSAPTYFINLNITFNHEICIKVRLEKTNLESAGLHHLCSLLHTAALTAARGDNLQINCRTHIHISVISQTWLTFYLHHQICLCYQLFLWIWHFKYKTFKESFSKYVF